MRSGKIKKGDNKVLESFDDIVFRDRNKAYGAYYLRKNYHKALIPGILITLIFPLALIIYQLYTNYINQELDSEDAIVFYDPSMIQQMDEFAYMQLLEPPQKSEQMNKDDADKPEDQVPIIVDSISHEDIVEEEKELKDTLGIESDSSSTGQNGFMDGVEDGGLSIYQVDSLPQFPGGNVALIRFVVNNIKYPEQAIKDHITGVVYIKFCIKSDGSINQIEVQKSINPLLDAEAVRVVRVMPKWKPGKLKNRNVNVMFSLPINFNLNNQSR
jgi:periplasmic protein TonB